MTIAGLFQARPAGEWETSMTVHDVPLVAVELRTPGEFSLEEQDLQERGLMVEVDSPEYGRYLRHGALQQFSAGELQFGPWEPVGGHARSILTELGYSADDIQKLVDERIVETPSEA